MIEFSPANIRMWSMLGSAGTFGVAALELPSLNDKILVLTADLRNFSGLDRFSTTFPEKFINVGIAEQNMVGVAAGLQNEGFSTFATTYSTFASARSADSVRVNMGYMGLGLKLVGMGAGFSVGLLGATHMGIDDIGILRSMPNLTIISPADCTETVKAVTALASFPGPVYLRLGGGVPHAVVYKSDYEFKIGKGIQLRSGTDATIVATGAVVAQSLEAAKLLEAEGYSVGLINMHTIKPLDTNLLNEVFQTSRLIVTVEEHNVIGGLGSSVAEHLSKSRNEVAQLSLGILDNFPHPGEYDFLLEQAGLTAPKIAFSIRKQLES
jgi:transketolase